MDTRELEAGLKGNIGKRIHFRGVYSSDALPPVKYALKPTIFIANTLASNANLNTVGHWVCFYVEYTPVRRIFFYDSYGLLPSFYTNEFLEYIL